MLPSRPIRVPDAAIGVRRKHFTETAYALIDSAEIGIANGKKVPHFRKLGRVM